MSSAKSPTPTPAELDDALQTALSEVCENAFFAFAEPCDAAQFAALARDLPASAAGARWLQASVVFAGTFEGSVEIALPDELGRWLVVSLLGMDRNATLSDAELFDGVGEFTNMACGAWLSRLSNRDLFELRVPAVTRMAPGWTPTAAAPGREEIVCRVTLNELPMRLRVHVPA